MKNITYPILLLIVLLSGCAKVTQESAPCIGPNPPKPNVQDAVIYSYSSGTVTDLGYHTGIYTWKGPNNFSQTTQSGSLSLDFYNSTNYGMYTVSYYYNGCTSDLDTFYIRSSPTAPPPCTPSTNNNLVASYGNNFNTTGGTLSISYPCGNNGYDIQSGTTSGYTFDMLTFTMPSSGGYYDLVSDCYYLNNTSAYVSLGGAGQTYYKSVSGRVYCNVIGGVQYVTFCSATFQRVSDGMNFSMTGNVSYH
jgi:hypothetical protein